MLLGGSARFVDALCCLLLYVSGCLGSECIWGSHLSAFGRLLLAGSLCSTSGLKRQRKNILASQSSEILAYERNVQIATPSLLASTTLV